MLVESNNNSIIGVEINVSTGHVGEKLKTSQGEGGSFCNPLAHESYLESQSSV